MAECDSHQEPVKPAACTSNASVHFKAEKIFESYLWDRSLPGQALFCSIHLYLYIAMMGSLWSGGHTSNVTQHQRLTPDKNSLTSEKSHYCFPLLLRKSFYRPRVYDSSSSSFPLWERWQLPITAVRQRSPAATKELRTQPPKKETQEHAYFFAQKWKKKQFSLFCTKPPKRDLLALTPWRSQAKYKGHQSRVYVSYKIIKNCVQFVPHPHLKAILLVHT